MTCVTVRYVKDKTYVDFQRKNVLKLVCNVNIVYGNLESENSQDYALLPRNLNEIVCS